MVFYIDEPSPTQVEPPLRSFTDKTATTDFSLLLSGASFLFHDDYDTWVKMGQIDSISWVVYSIPNQHWTDGQVWGFGNQQGRILGFHEKGDT
jgi:hypothetical protein